MKKEKYVYTYTYLKVHIHILFTQKILSNSYLQKHGDKIGGSI